MRKKAIVIHSGGLDSSLCLALAIKEFGAKDVLSLSFNYGQRHTPEIIQAAKICQAWGVDHVVLTIECMQEITRSALIGRSIAMRHDGDAANTLVMGRNGLMARLGAIHAQSLGAKCIFLGILEVDGKRNGYRDCTREYMDLKQQIMRIDLADPLFEIRTPLVHKSKKESLEMSYQLGILDFLLRESITCYEGIPWQGCTKCPSCEIRNTALREFQLSHPQFLMPFTLPAKWVSP
jgi:7-cyano-7-deazaguanine synthase